MRRHSIVQVVVRFVFPSTELVGTSLKQELVSILEPGVVEPTDQGECYGTFYKRVIKSQ